MNNYKNTLNLPATDFPMKANLVQREPEMLKHWEFLDLDPSQKEIAETLVDEGEQR